MLRMFGVISFDFSMNKFCLNSALIAGCLIFMWCHAQETINCLLKVIQGQNRTKKA